jgi:proprotein convertase subtilisin/kexin type 5
MCNTSSTYWLLEDQTCVSNCSQYHYLSNGSCLDCSTNCVQCLNSTVCQSCVSSYLYNSSCLQICPNLTYPDISLQCLACVLPCETCLDSQTCVTCITGYLLYLTYCVTSCPDQYWADLWSRKCVLQCDPSLFKYTQTRECYNTCP